MADNVEAPAVRVKTDLADLSIVLASGLGLALVTLFLCVVPLAGDIAGGRDYVVFWATGQQLVHHANPYDRDAMMRIERSAGLPAKDGVMYMRNLPWSLPLVLPLGFIGLRVGAFLWSLLLLVCLLASVLMLWRLHGSPNNVLHWLGFSFVPALLCVIMGQTTVFALLGCVLFLSLHRRRPYLAGGSLWLCALKPQLFLAFGVVLLAWILVSRSYKILAGAAAALAVSCAAVACVDPPAWSDYARMMRTAETEWVRIPCVSVVVRNWIRPEMTWLTYLPAALGCAWALGYFWSRRHRWDWMKDGSLVLLVSLLTAPYSWIYDDCVAIPGLLQGAYLTRMRPLIIVLSLSFVLIEIELISGVKIISAYYLWTAPAWLAWYLCAVRIKRTGIRGEPAIAVE